MKRIGMWMVASIMVVATAMPALALDVGNVSVRYAVVRVDEAVAGYVAEIVVTGTGLTGVNVKNLTTNNTFALTNIGLNTYASTQSFATLAAFSAVYQDPVSYLFTFNPGVGQDAIILGYNVAAPDNYINITHPDHLATDVELNPIYAWDSVAAMGLYQIGMRVRKQSDASVVYLNTPEFNTALTTWQPGALSALTAYNISLSGFSIMSGQPIATQTSFGQDPFTYYAYYEDSNQHRFTTGIGQVIPEPATLALVGTGVVGLLGALRRRYMK